MTGEEARQLTVAAKLALAEECLTESRFALEGGFFRVVSEPKARLATRCTHTRRRA